MVTFGLYPNILEVAKNVGSVVGDTQTLNHANEFV